MIRDVAAVMAGTITAFATVTLIDIVVSAWLTVRLAPARAEADNRDGDTG